MRVFFVVPESKGDVLVRPSSPHNGTAYLSAVLREHKHAVTVLDMRLGYSYDDLLERLQKFRPNLVAVTMTSRDFLKTYNLVDRLKNDSFKVVLGGPHPSTIGKQVLKDTKADYAVMGEGEMTLLDLADDKPIKSIRGLVWRGNKGIVQNKPREYIQDLDSLPFPAFDLFELDRYMDKKISIVSSRGCPYNCTYCSMRFTMGFRFRPRSAKNVVDELEFWYKRGYRYFAFVDDCFTFDTKRAEQVCDEILKRRLKVRWDLKNGIRVDKVNELLLGKMKQAGCFFVAFGVESADQEVLNKMKKGITVEMAARAVRLAKKVGIEDVSGFFIIGMPGDDWNKFKNTLDFALSLPFDEIRFYNAVPYPGTELFGWIKSNGKLLLPPENYLNKASRWDSTPVFETDNFSAKERQRAFVMAEKYVMKYLMQVELGKLVGNIAWLIWMPRFSRLAVMAVGKRVWTIIREIRTRVAV
ncbi:MAG: radical SAM protein [Candidatus Woesearchaeota archaeon]